MTFISKVPGESSILMKISGKCPGTGHKVPRSKNCTWQKVLRIQFYIRVPTFSLIRANGSVDSTYNKANKEAADWNRCAKSGCGPNVGQLCGF